MQIIHKNGWVVLRGIMVSNMSGAEQHIPGSTAVGEAALSESDVERLASTDRNSDIHVALRAARDFNRSAKMTKIAALEAQLQELKKDVK